MAELDSAEVINSILTPATPAPAASSQDAGQATKPAAQIPRNEAGRFVAAQTPRVPGDAPEEDDPFEEPDDEPAGEPVPAEEEEEPAEEEAAPDDIDDYLVDVTVDGKPAEVSLRDLKRSYSAAQYAERNIQQAVEFKNAAAQEQSYVHQLLGEQIQRLEAIEGVWQQFTTPNIDWQALKQRDPDAYARRRVEFFEVQERTQKIQAEINSRREAQQKIEAQTRQAFVQNETKILLEKLPMLADPQVGPQLRDKIFEVSRSYGVPDADVKALPGHVPVMILAELAYLRDRVAGYEQRLARPADGGQPQVKTMIRPGTGAPAVDPDKRLRAEQLKKAKASGKPEDVAALLVVNRRKAR